VVQNVRAMLASGACRGLTKKGYKRIPGGMELFDILVECWLCTDVFVKTDQTEDL
jgi:hypothetical protein